MTQAAFKKGQTVYKIGSWDNKGSFYYEKLIVGSCGAKQMHLLKMDGKTLQHRVYVSMIGNMDAFNCFDVFVAVEGFDPVAKALEMAAAFLPKERAFIQSRIDGGGSPGYIAAMQTKIAALHEPRAIDRTAD